MRWAMSCWLWKLGVEHMRFTALFYLCRCMKLPITKFFKLFFHNKNVAFGFIITETSDLCMNSFMKAEARLNGLSSGGKKETGCKQRRAWVWRRIFFFFFRVERLELGYILIWLSWGQGNVEKGRSLRR